MADTIPQLRSTSLLITKAAYDATTDEMRWAAVASDTEKDAFNTRMSLSLYKSFVDFVKRGVQVPAVFRSDAWEGINPYLSVSHYPDLNGYGIVGEATDLYVNGNKFKAKGIFASKSKPAMAKRAFEAVKADIVKNVPYNKRIRVSIGFLDWSHTHPDGSVFVRQSINEDCALCIANKGWEVTFTQGQLIHLALTRVPANTGTEITVETRSMANTLQEADAASIVGEEDAADLESRSKGTVTERMTPAVVIRTDIPTEEPAEPTGINADPVPEVPVPVPVARSMDPSLPYGGAMTVSDILRYKAAMNEVWQLWDMWDMFESALQNIWSCDDSTALPDSAAALSTLVADFKSNLTSRAVVQLAFYQSDNKEPQMAETPVTPAVPVPAPTQPTHPLDGAFAQIRAVYDQVSSNPGLDKATKVQQIQPALNNLQALLQRAMSPTGVVDEEALANKVTQNLLAALPSILQQMSMANGGAAVPVQGAVQRSVVTPTPVVHLSTPTPIKENINLSSQQPSNIRSIARTSVGLPAGS